MMTFLVGISLFTVFVGVLVTGGPWLARAVVEPGDRVEWWIGVVGVVLLVATAASFCWIMVESARGPQGIVREESP